MKIPSQVVNEFAGKNKPEEKVEHVDPHANTNSRQYTRKNIYDADPFAGLGIETVVGGFNNEALREFTESLSDKANNVRIKTRLKVDVLSVHSPHLLLPIVAISVHVKLDNNKSFVAVYSLLIESMMSRRLEPETRMLRGDHDSRTIIYDMPTSRCFDRDCRNEIIKNVAIHYGINPNETEVVLTAAHVIPRTAKLDDEVVRSTVFNNAWLSIVDYVGGTDNHMLNADRLRSAAAEVTLTTNYLPGATITMDDGEIVASDIAITMDLVKASANNYDRNSNYELDKESGQFNVHKSNNSMVLARCTVAIDFCPIPREARGMYDQQANKPLPGFMPQVIITSTSSGPVTAASTEGMSTALLSIVSAVNATRDYQWVRCFESNPGSPSRKTSLGVLALEHNPFSDAGDLKEVLVDAAAARSGKKDAMAPIDVARYWCTPDCAIAMDVREAGRSEWYQSAFLLAANGGAAANAAILAEADRLTDGHMSTVWAEMNDGNVNESVVFNQTLSVHLGTMAGDGDGRRDIHHVDYLTWLKYFGKDLRDVVKGTSCMLPHMNNPVTMTERRKMMSSFLTDLDIDAMGTRVYIKPKFAVGFVAALKRANVAIRVDCDNPYANTTGHGGISMGYGLRMTDAGVFTSGYNGGVGAHVYGNYYNPVFR